MPIPSAIVSGYLQLADAVFSRLTQLVPSDEKLRRCKIISHRGEHDNLVIKENTLAAFEHAAEVGVWGIELDVRWTRDLVPVVFHDEDLLRLYRCRLKIKDVSFADLKKHYPDIPALSEVIQRFGKKVHLMIEVKRQRLSDPSKQLTHLNEILSPLEPSLDYHLLTLYPEMLALFQDFPLAALVAIADRWPRRLSRWIRQRRWGGLCGHFLLVHNGLLWIHHQHAQKVGTGFVKSRNCLYREINRGVDWVFSNDAVHLQGLLNTRLATSGKGSNY
ncbi:MAG: glycerophosphodiester phosphodiesterase family protein [Desulfobacteraceae bacterium]|jgi:glycerophosphoryl diester phosphodiesterase